MSSAPFDNLLNFRDVAESVNKHAGREIMTPGLLYRSARPDDASPADRQRLVNEYGIKTIIDLRTDSERLAQAEKHGSRNTARDTAHPLDIPGIAYRCINFNGPAYSRALLKQLTWGQTARFLTLYAFNDRASAIAILGRSAIAPHGLLGLATSTLTYSGAAIRALFTLLYAPLPPTTPSPNPTYPILIHCTQGKDRTGLSILLLLLLLHAPLSAIAADYAASEAELLPELNERLAQIRAMGLPDAFAHCEDGWTESLSQWLDERYGGVEAYLGSVGVRRAECEWLRDALGVRGGGN
ncbi:hypothetical protein B0A49_03159 [Cryomyces minteri]|uniref:Tyrosine specific protein phosphatases domain-containing protein n=1 Tax=Cryomyces minteri TaxID=331657 RepID=A0A4V6WLA8_9PEZI|nr:hypothetical protein B0A49_03159 [Cryomyces minteri]